MPIAKSGFRRPPGTGSPTTKLLLGHGSKPGLRPDPAGLATLGPVAKVCPLTIDRAVAEPGLGLERELGLWLELVSSWHFPDHKPVFFGLGQRRLAYPNRRRFEFCRVFAGAGRSKQVAGWQVGRWQRLVGWLLADERKRNGVAWLGGCQSCLTVCQTCQTGLPRLSNRIYESLLFWPLGRNSLFRFWSGLFCVSLKAFKPELNRNPIAYWSYHQGLCLYSATKPGQNYPSSQ